MTISVRKRLSIAFIVTTTELDRELAWPAEGQVQVSVSSKGETAYIFALQSQPILQ